MGYTGRSLYWVNTKEGYVMIKVISYASTDSISQECNITPAQVLPKVNDTNTLDFSSGITNLAETNIYETTVLNVTSIASGTVSAFNDGLFFKNNNGTLTNFVFYNNPYALNNIDKIRLTAKSKFA